MDHQRAGESRLKRLEYLTPFFVSTGIDLNYVIEPPVPDVVSVADSASKFPVNALFCVGRNYADHAIEMGGDPNREPPFFFIKPAFTLLNGQDQMRYPSFTSDVHHEVELVVAIGKGGANIAVEAAAAHIWGYCVGIDMTRRDLQAEAKSKSRPWEAGKSFVHAAPCGDLRPISATGPLDSGTIELSVNGEIRQHGDINQMIWKIPEIISRLSELFVLRAGDLIMTGTPAGVGPVVPGDRIEARIERLPTLSLQVSADG